MTQQQHRHRAYVRGQHDALRLGFQGQEKALAEYLAATTVGQARAYWLGVLRGWRAMPSS